MVYFYPYLPILLIVFAYRIADKLYDGKPQGAYRKEQFLLRSILGSFLFTGGLAIVQTYWGQTIPDAWFERSRYIRNLYVNIFPEESKSQNYRVSATIACGEDEFGNRAYFLHEATLPNGKKFELQIGEREVRLFEIVICKDWDDVRWGIELTNLPAD